MDPRRGDHEVDLPGGKSQMPGDRAGVRGHALRVLVGVLVPAVDGVGERHQGVVGLVLQGDEELEAVVDDEHEGREIHQRPGRGLVRVRDQSTERSHGDVGHEDLAE